MLSYEGHTIQVMGEGVTLKAHRAVGRIASVVE